MRSRGRWTIVVLVVTFCVAVPGVYWRNAQQIEIASLLRRSGQLAKADNALRRCWKIPWQLDAIRLEAQLAAVQQGNLRDETSLQKLATTGSKKTGLMILEALCKGNMAVFRWNDARLWAEEMLSRSPGDSTAIWLRGQCWVKLQQEEKALDDFKQAVVISPTVWEYRLSLAELLQQLGRNHQSRKMYVELVQEKHFDAQVLLGLSRCLQDAGAYHDAERTLKFFVETYPRSSEALVELARLALRQGNAEAAEKWARTALAISPRNQEVIFVLSLSLDAQGKQDNQLRDRTEKDDRTQVEIKKLLRDSSNDPAALCRVGEFMMETDQEQEAIGCFQRALRVDAENNSAHQALAEYFAKVGQIQLANQHKQAIGKGAVEELVTKFTNSNARDASPQLHSGFPPPALPAAAIEASKEQVQQLCGTCHAYPPPETFPRFAWRKEVQLGFDFLRDSSMSGTFPSLESVVLYYENRAPDRLPTKNVKIAQAPLSIHFEIAGGGWLKDVPPFPATTHVNFVRLQPKKNHLDLLVCDARLDRILALKTEKSPPEWTVLGPALVPSHAEVVDLDGDGHLDVIVGCLGQVFPTDDKVGSVVWLRGQANGTYLPVTLLDGVGRVADVQAADFNRDGRTDLIVAVFGWRKNGEILYLQNETIDWTQPQFRSHRIDNRHGTIHVPVADLNQDGLPDFVALISQEHEAVVAFLNEGAGRFRPETLFAAPHPAFGCSGIELVDMDLDNDLDVLLTNGDVLDRPYILKPDHGVQWLENTGQFPYRVHPIANMYGASRAVAADVDGDRDVDVFAVSFLPAAEFPDRERLRIPSAILFEQIQPGNFVAHILETGSCDHFSCAAADWNGDGQADIAFGNFSWKRSHAIPDATLLLKGVK